MDFQGTVQGGVVVLDGGAALPDGTRVRVTADVAPGPSTADAPRPSDPHWRLRFERMVDDARRFTSALPAGFVGDDSRDAVYAGRDGE